MIMRLRRLLILLLLIFTNLFSYKPLFGQTLFANWFPGRTISFEYYHPAFRNPSTFKALSSYSFLNLNWQIDDKTELIADLPWAYAHSIDSVQSISAYTIGNPYLGLQFRKPLSVIFFEAGVRFPVTKIYQTVSQFANKSLLSRNGAFRNRTWTLKSDINFHYEYETGFGMRLRAGPRILVPVRSGNPVLMLDYSAQIRLKTRYFMIGAAYIGNLDATKSLNTSIHQLVFETMINGKVFEPQFHLYIPHQAKGNPDVHYILGFGLKMVLDNI